MDHAEIRPIDISVVIPVRDREDMIGACVRSVLGQTCPPREVVVVDDGSTDGTWTGLERMAEADPRVRPIRLAEGRGAQHARNVGIKSARSPWIAFLDSDDVWVEDKLAVQVEVLRERDCDLMTVVYSDFWCKDGDDASLVYVPLASFGPPHALRKALIGYGALFQGMLVSKEALERIGWLDEDVPAYQEWDTTIRLASICRFVHIARPLFIWIRHGKETISGNAERGQRGYEHILDRHGEAMISVGGRALYLRHLFLIAHGWAAAGVWALRGRGSGRGPLGRWIVRAVREPLGID